MPELSSPEFSGRRVLVTGGNGFIGAHLVERLLQSNAEVGVLGRRLGPLAAKAGLLRFLKADLKDATAVHNALSSFHPEIIFHLASRPDGAESFEHSHASIQDNLIGTLNLLEAHRHTDSKGLIVLGDSTKSYGNVEVPYRESAKELPNSSYAITKAAAWEFTQLYSRLHDFPAVCVRPTLIFGPGQAFNIISYVVKCVDEQLDRISLAGGQQTRDPLFVDDAVDAYLASAQPKLNGRVITIGGGYELSVLELTKKISELAGGNALVVSEPGNARPTEIWRSWCDNKEALELTGWFPRTSLDNGLRRTIDWIRNETTQVMDL